MPEFLKVKVEVDTRGIEDHFNDLCHDDTTMLELHNLLAKYNDPYVPFLNGPLSQTVEVTPEGVTYVQPYAHYQYHGTHFNHTLDYHPRATAEWDKVMMQEKGEQFTNDVRNILVRRYKELYG